ncbi:hypothetical protein VNI00_008754 [Paramarasmius palmivorus]|uniref:Heterokaryon incompatibility domain-containing protein n=1 Tax=Paramarasmius palmivorus TaxID=297713 RepID=A0AAW0CW27_9AGAR
MGQHLSTFARIYRGVLGVLITFVGNRWDRIQNRGSQRNEDTSHHPQSLKTVASVPITELSGCVVNTSPQATSCRFRLLDVASFLDMDTFEITEFPGIIETQNARTDLSQIILPPYAAISYPWRDLQHPQGTSAPSFSVAGALHADPISIDVLKTACLAARAYGCGYIWLDRLSILQGDKKDKNWQIQRMFHVYKQCCVCLVFPGGLVRLAKLDDSTTWIDRAWTLQETVAPGVENTKVVIHLSHPTYTDYLRHRCKDVGYTERFSDLYVGEAK